jgi:pantoate--beta-alanine ligase
MSSRNELLTREQRDNASIIYKALLEVEIAAEKGERNTAKLAEIVRKEIESEPLAKIDYVAVVDNNSLDPIENIGEGEVLVAVAVRFGDVRLIDNIVLNQRQ